MHRKSFIEMTSLLDIILILLFVFIFNMSQKEDSNIKKVEEVLQENEFLMEENQKLSNKIEEIQTLFSEEKEKSRELTESISRFFHSNQQDFSDKLNQLSKDEREEIQDLINNMGDEETITKELLKYNAVSSRFLFIDIALSTSDNVVYIDGKKTSIIIPYESLQNELGKNQKKAEIKEQIEEILARKEGGISMALISLTILDEEVYRYAYNLVWDCIEDIETKYGPRTIYKTEYPLL